jgi:hypothetical protein
MTSAVLLSAARIPLSALLPGLAGLIPFWALALSGVLPMGIPPIIALLAFLTYGAVILSFVGAIWWGMAVATAMQTPKAFMFVWSVMPALIGWFATLMPADLGILILAVGFVIQWLLDAGLSRWYPAIFPAWVFRLRTILTAGVLGAVAAAWWWLV